MRRFNGYVVIASVMVGIGSPGDGALAKPAVVPQPVAMVVRQGEFAVSDQTQVVANSRSANEARKLIDALAPAM
jgi:ABC-type Fe3+ transport system substrate-binding protein